MNTKLKQLIEDAAKLLGLEVESFTSDGVAWVFPIGIDNQEEYPIAQFNPLDPERGDLMKVAEAAELVIDMREGENAVYWEDPYAEFPCREGFTKGDYQSLALAVLRAASAVLKARGE